MKFYAKWCVQVSIYSYQRRGIVVFLKRVYDLLKGLKIATHISLMGEII